MNYSIDNKGNIDNNLIMNYLKENEKRIISFFKEISTNIFIKILKYEDFKNEYENYLDCEIKDYITGFIEDNKNTVCILTFEDYSYTSHTLDSIDDFLKVIMHEIVHLVHGIKCNYNYPRDDYYEGVAYYLANQIDNEYYHLFKQIVEDVNHKKLLEELNIL